MNFLCKFCPSLYVYFEIPQQLKTAQEMKSSNLHTKKNNNRFQGDTRQALGNDLQEVFLQVFFFFLTLVIQHEIVLIPVKLWKWRKKGIVSKWKKNWHLRPSLWHIRISNPTSRWISRLDTTLKSPWRTFNWSKAI